MQYQGIFTKREYITKDNITKSAWYKVGYLKTTEQGGQFIRLFNQPDTSFYVFTNEDETLPEIQIEDKV
jgi:hypothetical protein